MLCILFNISKRKGNKMKNKELIGIVAHEIMHCAVGHLFGKGNRDHERWNIADDHAINLILQKNGYTLPEGGMIDKNGQETINRIEKKGNVK